MINSSKYGYDFWSKASVNDFITRMTQNGFKVRANGINVINGQMPNGEVAEIELESPDVLE